MRRALSSLCEGLDIGFCPDRHCSSKPLCVREIVLQVPPKQGSNGKPVPMMTFEFLILIRVFPSE